MTSNFSAVLLDLNDYIGTAQACTNPFFLSDANDNARNNDNGTGGPKISLVMETEDVNRIPPVITPPTVLASRTTPAPPTKGVIRAVGTKAQVSLSDCLACSGCVTSAETVLLKEQSAAKFAGEMSNMAAGTSRFRASVVTISQQSRASLATACDVSPAQMQAYLRERLRRDFGTQLVLDMGALATDISLLETAQEFVERYRGASTVATLAQTPSLPLLVSACPGFVCYAEKTHPILIPHLSTVKSSQQIAGVLAKTLLARRLGLANPSQVFLASVAPCPDKKLEASRAEHRHGPTEADVDCVLTTTELCDLLFPGGGVPAMREDLTHFIERGGGSEGGALVEGVEESITSMFDGGVANRMVTADEAGAGNSGGYLAFVFRYASKVLFGVDIPPGPLPLRQGRNADVRTLELEVEGRAVLRFWTAYGFRNIQEVVRRVKRGPGASGRIDFVEVMACPSGCLNGGGNFLGSAELPIAERRYVLDRVRVSAETGAIYRSPLDNPLLERLYSEFVGDAPGSSRSRELFHTSFKSVVGYAGEEEEPGVRDGEMSEGKLNGSVPSAFSTSW